MTPLLFEDADDPAGALRWNLGQVRRLLGLLDALSGRVLSLRGTDVAFDVDLLTKGRWQDAWELPALGGELLADPCWETWAAHGLGLHAIAAGDEAAALSHLADAITRSRPQRDGHLWSHVWALTLRPSRSPGAQATHGPSPGTTKR